MWSGSGCGLWGTVGGRCSRAGVPLLRIAAPGEPREVACHFPEAD